MNNIILNYYSGFKSSLGEGAKLGGAWRSSVGTFRISRAKREGFRMSETQTKTSFIRQIVEVHYFMESPVETRQRAVPFSQTGWRLAVCRDNERAASFQ